MRNSEASQKLLKPSMWIFLSFSIFTPVLRALRGFGGTAGWNIPPPVRRGDFPPYAYRLYGPRGVGSTVARGVFVDKGGRNSGSWKILRKRCKIGKHSQDLQGFSTGNAETVPLEPCAGYQSDRNGQVGSELLRFLGSSKLPRPAKMRNASESWKPLSRPAMRGP